MPILDVRQFLGDLNRYRTAWMFNSIRDLDLLVEDEVVPGLRSPGVII